MESKAGRGENRDYRVGRSRLGIVERNVREEGEDRAGMAEG